MENAKEVGDVLSVIPVFFFFSWDSTLSGTSSASASSSSSSYSFGPGVLWSLRVQEGLLGFNPCLSFRLFLRCVKGLFVVFLPIFGALPFFFAYSSRGVCVVLLLGRASIRITRVGSGTRVLFVSRHGQFVKKGYVELRRVCTASV